MNNRGYLARLRAKGLLPSQAEEAVAETVDETPLVVVLKDPASGEVVQEFESVQAAVEDGYSKPHIVGAIKNGNKYKGYLWSHKEI